MCQKENKKSGGYLGGAVVFGLEVVPHPTKLLHGQPACANGARAADPVTLALQLPELFNGLQNAESEGGQNKSFWIRDLHGQRALTLLNKQIRTH